MRVIVVGAGAVGGLLGAMLAKQGADVAFVARGATRDRLRTKGVSVTTLEGAFESGPFSAESEPEALAPADVVFVAVKTFQIAALAPRLRGLLRPSGVAISLLNGVEAADVLVSALGEASVLGGLCHVLAVSEGPGVVSVKGAALRVTLGELGGGSSARVETIASVLRAAGVTLVIPEDVKAELWSKLMFVGSLGLIGAATGLSADQFRAIPASRELLIGAMDEVRRVAMAKGVIVPDAAKEAALARIDALPAGARTSMQRDLEARRPSELEEQIGVIVRFAREAALSVPIHAVLHATLIARSA